MGLAIGLYYLLWVIGLQYYIAIDEFGLVSQRIEANFKMNVQCPI